jgi:purine nucleoside phosphorylase
MRKSQYEEQLSIALDVLKGKLFPHPDDWRNRFCPVDCDPPAIGLVLGTGWGDTVVLDEASASVPLADLPGFETLEELTGHARRLTVGKFGGKNVAVLSGRVHMNETTFNPEHGPAMVRMQIELLLALGVQTLILTAGVGGLTEYPRVKQVAVINNLVTVCAGPMPMFPGEFEAPKSKLDGELINLAMKYRTPNLQISPATHCFVRGPWFESLLDKNILRTLGPKMAFGEAKLPDDNRVVGMSILPELCVAALYKDVRTLALGYVTNGPAEKHSHESNVAAAQSKAELLGDLLRNIVNGI